jgi:hypothetical protein
MFRAQHPEMLTLIALPCVAGQRSSRSNITAPWFDSIPVVREVTTAMRTIKNAMPIESGRNFVQRTWTSMTGTLAVRPGVSR